MKKHSGFSILELLISLMLGLVVVAGIVQLFVGNSRTYEVVTAQSRLQENARYSFDFITEAARNAGHFGCAPERENFIKGLVGDWNTIPEYDASRAVGGFDSAGGGAYAPNDLLTLPRTEGSTNLNVHIPGNGIDRNELEEESDIVIFRSIRQPGARLSSVAFPNSDPVLSTPGGEPAFAVNDVVVIADCQQGAIFRVTGVASAANTTTLSRATSAGGSNFNNADFVITMADPAPAAIPATMSSLNLAYGAEAIVSHLDTTIFFIAPSTQLNSNGDETMALWRKVSSDAPQELVQGVSNMQVTYGVDTTLDDVPNVNQYLTIDAVADPNTIVSVRVQIDVSSVDPLAENGNAPIERTYSKTIGIRNAGV